MTRRGRRLDWSIYLVLALVIVAALVLWRGDALGRILPSLTGDHPTSMRSADSNKSVALSQPDPDGYEYRVTEERYVVATQNGKQQVQERRRESWCATDGWAWARQTGIDPGRFIFAPSPDWKQILQAQPTGSGLGRVMEKKLTGVPRAELAGQEFSFANDLLSSDSLRDSSLPIGYRRALVDALARNEGVTVTAHTADPRHRDSIRVTLTDSESTQSLYFNQEYQYLAFIGKATKSGETASKIVVDRRNVGRIPAELLKSLGSKRIAKAIWK